MEVEKRRRASFIVPTWVILPVVVGRSMGPVECEQLRNASFVETPCWA